MAGQSCFVLTECVQSVGSVLDGEESAVRTETGTQQAAKIISYS